LPRCLREWRSLFKRLQKTWPCLPSTVNYLRDEIPLLRIAAVVLLLCLCLTSLGFASAYNAQPRLIVVIVIDQFRGDYLERYRDQFGEGGFKLLLDRGAYFTECNFNYANTVTAAGHATLFTGAYSDGHGILGNDWWDPQKERMVTSVEDDATRLVGISSTAPGASPHNLLADTLGDELKLATQGKSRVFWHRPERSCRNSTGGICWRWRVLD